MNGLEMRDKFIDKSIVVHGHVYDYSLVNYINSHTKVKIICNKHGEFMIKPYKHTSDQGCRECYLEKVKKNNKNNRIKRIIKSLDGVKYIKIVSTVTDGSVNIMCEIHKNKINLKKAITAIDEDGEKVSPCDECRNNKRNIKRCKNIAESILKKIKNITIVNLRPITSGEDEIIVRCDKHKYTYDTTLNNLACVKYCCRHGVRESVNNAVILNKRKKLFIKKSNMIHNNKYDYSEVKYINNKTKVSIKCHMHGVFYQKPNNHLCGAGCPDCANEKLRVMFRTLTDDLIRKFRKIHGDKYDYSKVSYVNVNERINIICPHHGIFTQIPSVHMSGSGCPSCVESKGERIIRVWLENNNIEYIKEYKIYGFKYRYDYYLPNHNLLIEFDGIQHYEPVKFLGGVDKYYKTVSNDIFKNIIAGYLGYRLLRIPHYNVRYIGIILSSTLR